MPQRSNPEWVRDLAAGGTAQEAALADLGALLRRTSLFYIRRRLAGEPAIADDEIEALAQDCSQEASLRVLERLPSFRGEAQFSTWAASFAISLTMTTLRRRLWRDLSLDRLPDGWQEPASTALPNNGWSNPLLAAQRVAIWETIREVVLHDLTARQRQVLNLVVIQGVATEVLGERMQATPSALYKLTHDARRKLKAGLLQRGFSTDEILSAFAAET